MRYYGIINQNAFLQDETDSFSAIGYIEMKAPRPSPEHIANAKGEWILPEPQPEVIDNETDTENAS